MNTERLIETVFLVCISVGYIAASDSMAQNMEKGTDTVQSSISTKLTRPILRDESVKVHDPKRKQTIKNDERFGDEEDDLDSCDDMPFSFDRKKLLSFFDRQRHAELSEQRQDQYNKDIKPQPFKKSKKPKKKTQDSE